VPSKAGLIRRYDCPYRRDVLLLSVSFLSNFRPRRSPGIGGESTPTCSSRARAGAASGVAADPRVNGKLASEAQVVEFLRFSLHRGIDTNSIWVAEARGRMLWALLPSKAPATPCFCCAQLYRHPSQHLAAELLTDQVVDQYRQRGVQLAQVLLEPIESPMLQFYQSVSFQIMAELIYLQATPRRGAMPPSRAGGSVFMEDYSTKRTRSSRDGGMAPRRGVACR